MTQGSVRVSPERERQALVAILVFAFLHGLLFIFIVPPWQHYDEPNHFEYVWLIVNRPGYPQLGDYDQSMRREVAVSMLEHGFFEGMEYRPDLDPPAGTFTWIGTYQQLIEPPLYYSLASLPLILYQFDDITSQLYAARFVSLMLFVLTVWISWKVVAEITPQGHPLRILVPLSLAMLPGFVDSMTAVNNDTAAVVISSLFLWGSVRLISRGFSIPGLIWVILTAFLAYWVKNTAYFVLLIVPIVVIISFLRGKKLWLIWGLLLAGVLAGFFVFFYWGDALYWYRQSNQDTPTRVASPLAPVGEYAMSIEIQPGASPRYTQIRQVIPYDDIADLQGKTVTLGAWMWASEPIEVFPPMLVSNQGNILSSNQITLDEKPTFYKIEGTLAPNIDLVWVALAPINIESDKNVKLYYDGLVFTEGIFSEGASPEFDGIMADSGSFMEQPFDNLLRNSSFERGTPAVRPWADKAIAEILPHNTRPSLILYTLQDSETAGLYYRFTILNLIRTFWGKFGWGHVPLLGHKPYRVVGLLTLVGLIGAGVAIWRKRFTLSKSIVLLGALALIISWVVSLLRGSIYIFTGFFIPSARYSAPVIIPTLIVINLGWLELFNFFERRIHFPPWVKYLIFFLCVLALDIYAIISIINFYQGSFN